MGKRLILFLVVGVLILGSVDFVSAKKKLPHASGGSSTGGAKAVASSTKGVNSQVKFRGDRKALNINFSNLGIAKSVNYAMSYEAAGVPQGVGGTIQNFSENSTSREILFGTCSHGACRYDRSITNAKLTITTFLKSGKKVVKSYKLKV
jgi:hypothetical protein